MRIIGIIPARWASSRFPGKPLALINGKTMIRRVYERALQCAALQSVLVATDDQRIAQEVKSFGGTYVITRPDHPSGTDRCLEALKKCGDIFDAVINIQGDEPYIDPEHIRLLTDLISRPGSQLATLVCPINDHTALFDPNVVKTVLGRHGNALYFSRQPIPFHRGADPEGWHQHHTYYRHLGMYAYTVDALAAISRLEVSPLEKAESLEQLRWLENGFTISVGVIDEASPGVDVPEDVDKLRNFFDKRP